MPELAPQDKVLALRVVLSATAALAWMILEFMLLIRDEVNFVWSRIRMSWTARMYMLTRYAGIASQICNVCFTVRMYQGIHTSPRGCRVWFAYQAISVQFLLFFAEGLLMQRLYALFLRSHSIFWLLVLFVVSQVASMGVSARLAFPSNKHTATCMMMSSNPGSAFFSATTMTTTTLIFFMTFWRYLYLPSKWVRGALGWVVMRDSAMSLAAITVIMLFLTLCSLNVIKPAMGGNITFYWFISVLWASIGRIVVNHERIRVREAEHEESGGTWTASTQLTSQIEMGQMSSLSSTSSTQSGSIPHPPSSNTLQSSLSVLVSKEDQSKGSQLSPMSPCTSDSSGTWFGDRSPSDADVRRHSPRPSKHSADGPSASTCDSGSGAPQTEDRPPADAGECVPTPSPDPRPPSSESPSESVEVSS